MPRRRTLPSDSKSEHQTVFAFFKFCCHAIHVEVTAAFFLQSYVAIDSVVTDAHRDQ